MSDDSVWSSTRTMTPIVDPARQEALELAVSIRRDQIAARPDIITMEPDDVVEAAEVFRKFLTGQDSD